MSWRITLVRLSSIVVVFASIGCGGSESSSGGGSAPIITSFTAEKGAVTVGKGTTLTAVFEGGSGVIDHGVGAVTTGVAIPTGNLDANTVYTLTVTSASGETATKTANVNAVAGASITSFVAVKPKVTTGKPAQLMAVFTGTGSVDKGVGAITTGAAKATPNVTANTTFTLTVSNEAGDSVTKTADVTTVAPGAITSFTAADAKVSRYSGTMLTAVFTGGTGSIDQGVGAVTSNVAIASGNVDAANKVFTLSVTNELGDAETKTLDVVAKKELMFPQVSGDSILVFDEDAEGNVAPKRTIAGAATLLTTPFGSTVVGEEIIIGNANGSRVNVYNVTDTGNVAPKRSIAGATTTINGSYGVRVLNNELFVTGFGGAKVNVFNLSDTGDVAPKRTIMGATTELGNPVLMSFSNNEVFVANYPSAGVKIFNVTDMGDVAPKRKITITNAVGTEIVGDDLIVTSTNAVTTFNKNTGVQLRQIIGAATGFSLNYNCTPLGEELYCNDASANRVAIFPRNGDGNIAPTRVISGAATTFNGPAVISIH